MTKADWMVSLHGGHSGEFCDHAEGPLRAMLEAAVEAGYDTFGVSEHVPRPEARFLYTKERALGWDVPKIEADFDRYSEAITPLAQEFADRLIVLRGFEAEVVPTADYAERIRRFRERKLPDGSPVFDYFVGSVHYVEELSIDGELEEFGRAVEICGGLEGLAVRYYEKIVEMIAALKPDVVGHLDLIKKNAIQGGYDLGLLETPAVLAAIEKALDAAQTYNVILDLNTAGWRKGLGSPYPSAPLVQQASRMGIPFCFGDDSHRPTDVGAGVEQAREYLFSNGVPTITALTRLGAPVTGQIVRKLVTL